MSITRGVVSSLPRCPRRPFSVVVEMVDDIFHGLMAEFIRAAVSVAAAETSAG
jgi:hypothetical protein